MFYSYKHLYRIENEDDMSNKVFMIAGEYDQYSERFTFDPLLLQDRSFFFDHEDLKCEDDEEDDDDDDDEDEDEDEEDDESSN